MGVVTVGQQRHGLRTAHGPHLLHSQQLAGRQDGGVRPTAELACGGDATTSEDTPASCAGTTFMITLEGYTALPPGTYRPRVPQG